jgi:hypothetical protein
MVAIKPKVNYDKMAAPVPEIMDTPLYFYTLCKLSLPQHAKLRFFLQVNMQALLKHW